MEILDNEVDELSKEDLAELVKSGSELSANINLDELLHKILSRACKLTDSLDSSVILYNNNRKSLYFACATGNNAITLLEKWGEYSQQQVPLDGSKAGQVFTSRISIIQDRLEKDPNHFKGVDKDTKSTSDSMVCVPLIADSDCIGVMQLLNKVSGNYTTKDKTLLENFAIQSTIALRNARHFEDLVSHMGFFTSPEERQKVQKIVKEINETAKQEFVTIMFADMRGSTQLWHTFSKEPITAQKILKEFLTLVSDEIIQHNGIVNKFLGDGVLAIYREEDHAKRAIYAAFAMLAQFPYLKERWDNKSRSPLDYMDIGIGIATGMVIIGSLGTDKVRDYTVFGDPVNLASLFESQARNGKRILVDWDTYESVKDIVSEVDGPKIIHLKKDDQINGFPYKQFHIKRLKLSAGQKVFISHNSADKQYVKQISEALRGRGIEIWYDEKDLVPGFPWQDQLEKIIIDAKSALILIGKDGLGVWEQPEIQACLSEFVHRKMPVIPVLLPGSPSTPDIPLFLSQFMWVDLRDGITQESIDKIALGVTGVK